MDIFAISTFIIIEEMAYSPGELFNTLRENSSFGSGWIPWYGQGLAGFEQELIKNQNIRPFFYAKLTNNYNKGYTANVYLKLRGD